MTQTALAKPEQGDRSLAAGVHIGAIFVPLWVPLIAWLVTRGKREFVAAHARQSLVETIVLNTLIFIAMVASFVYTVASVYSLWQGGLENVEWWPLIWQSLLRIGFWWLAMGILWVINLIVSIRQAIQAFNGEWPKSWKKKMARQARRA